MGALIREQAAAWEAVLAPASAGAMPDDASAYTTSMCMRVCVQGMRTSVLFDDELAAAARELGINVSEAAVEEGLRRAVRRRRAEQDRVAYPAHPEVEDADRDEAESWGEELDVRANVTVADITTLVPGLTVEVPVDPDCGIEQASVVACDGLYTVSQRMLTRRLGSVDDDTLDGICEGVAGRCPGVAGGPSPGGPAGGDRGDASGLRRAVLAYDEVAARHYARLQESRRGTGRPLAVEDGMIAAICVARGTRLATRNRSHFAGLGLELVDPWSAAS